jgi:hypothetical protein
VSAALIVSVAGSTTSSPNGPDLDLSVPLYAGGAAAVFIVIMAGVIACRMSNGLSFRLWIRGPVYAGPAWTAKDSWVTNMAAVGAILGIVITDSGTALKLIVLQTPLAGVTLLFIVLGGAAAVAPVVYGATAKIESQGITDTTGLVWGLLLAGAASIFAVVGEMATMGLLVWDIADTTATKWAIIIALGLGGAAIGLYSVRSLMYFATLPAPRPIKQPPTTSMAIGSSLLGNKTFSATI